MSELNSLLSRLARLVAGDGYLHSLKPVQLQALRFLAGANRFTRTPRGLTAWLGLTKGTVSQTLAVLERKNLVTRSSDATDRRIVRLDLTEAGRDMLAESGDMAEWMIGSLDNAEKAMFAAIIKKMLHAHLAANGHRPMGICANCKHFEKAAHAGLDHRCALLNVGLTDADSQFHCLEQVAA
jgi:DNA-binding MarR family transcriptional regulator